MIALHARFRNFQYWHEAAMALLAAVLFIAMGALDPSFIRWPTQVELSTHVWELAILAVPMTLIIVTAGIDLSVGSAMALSAVALGLVFEAGYSPWAGAVAAIVVGCLAGLLNGVFVAWMRVHPLIVTLATLAAFRGIAEGISVGRPISGFPASFAYIGQGTALGLPVPALVFLVFLCVGIGLLGFMPVGRFLYAMGHNETAARYSGVAVDRIKLFLYGFAGASAGVAAVLFVARRNTAKADVATGMELDVITAVVLGGTSIFGGRGTLVGTLLGVFLIHEVREFVSWRWQRDELNFIVLGTLLILAVLLNRLLAPKGRE